MSATPELTSVDALLAERDRVVAWLARLDERTEVAPEPVVARVRDDYRRRLDAVTAQLDEHRRTITERLATDLDERAQLAARVLAAREGLAEAELRHMVGEYDDARFATERDRQTASLSALEEEMSAVAGRITRLENVLAIFDASPREATPAAEEEPIGIELLAPAEPMMDFEVTVSEIEASAAEPLMFEEALPDLLEEEALEEPPATPMTAPADDIGPLSFRPSGSGSARPAVPPSAPPLGMPATEEMPRFARTPAPPEPPRPAESPVAIRPQVPVPADDPGPISPPPSAGEDAVDTAARTLRCGECGAMNRALEWYCEKCGAELTAT